ncbi:hypothetical protein LTR05_000501 [Lithohypha guttulata]|uniref:Uncharacterized protein n=1 Tax=Lithohypha guttulata TaxID=1690604 RepID=A0AAN7TBW2_9EURO|nr:hypothetical protein LTR05_000501 [Lithohypha guttulata]
MPLLSSFLLIESAAAALLAISALLITSPTRVLSSTTLSLLGSSMHIRTATFIPDPVLPRSDGSISHSSNPLTSLTPPLRTTLTISEREIISLLGLVIAATAFSTIILAFPLRFSRAGLTARTTDDAKVVRKSSTEVGESIAKLNLTQTTWQVFAGMHVIFASLLVAWMYVFRSQRGIDRVPLLTQDVDAASLLVNNITFTIGMVDMLFWGYLYTTIKEERRVVLSVMERRRSEDEEDDANKAM